MRTALIITVLLAACGGPTEIVVLVAVDLPISTPGNGFTGVNVTGTLNEICFDLTGLDFGEPIAEPVPDPAWHSVVEVPGAPCSPYELGIVPRGDWSGKEVGVEVRGISRCTDSSAAYLYARGETRFVEGRVSTLALSFTTECVAANADASLACPVTNVPTPLGYVPAVRSCK